MPTKRSPARMPPCRAAAGALTPAVLLALVLCGCGGEGARLRGPSAERAYAEGMFVPAVALGAGWGEVSRGLIARTSDGSSQREPAVGANLVDPESALVLAPDAPCRICAGIAYGLTGTEAPASAPALTVVYFYQQLYALPLGEKDALPEGFVTEWLRGPDGMALGVNRDGRAEAPAPAPANDDPPAGAPGGIPDKPESVVAPPNVQEWGIDPSDTLVEERLEDLAKHIGLSATEVYLAAKGVVVKISASSALPRDSFVQSVAAIRRRMAGKLAAEQALQQEMAQRRAAQKGRVVLEAQKDPESKMYWGLLEKAMGVIYKKRY